VVIPTYDNRGSVAAVVRQVATVASDIIVVDDGSARETRDIVAGLHREGLAIAVHRGRNGGKGAAVMTGLTTARDIGYSHAVQVDADGQHDLNCLRDFLAAAEANPEAAILGWPEFDEDAPKSRLRGRRITQFWVNIETGGRIIEDAMVGFRVYPIGATLTCGARCRRMDYDIEVAVRLAWAGVPIINLPVGVRYLSEEEGGISHFRMVRDNLQISWLHTRLTTQAVFRWLFRAFRRRS